MKSKRAQRITCIMCMVILLLWANFASAQQERGGTRTQKQPQRGTTSTEQPARGELKTKPSVPAAAEETIAPGKTVPSTKKRAPEKGQATAQGFERLFTVLQEGYEYRFTPDTSTFLKIENPLTVSTAAAMKDIMPVELLKSKYSPAVLKIENINRVAEIKTEARLVPVTFTQLATIKSLALAPYKIAPGYKSSFSRQLALILEQGKGDLMTYGLKQMGGETYTDIAIYSRKKYLRGLAFPDGFKRDMDRYLAAALLMTGARDRAEKGDMETARMFLKGAADVIRNNPLVLTEAAKYLLELK